MENKSIKICYNELELCINGYEKYRKVEDDSWASVSWKVNNYAIQFQNFSYAMLSYEVEGLRDKLNKYINGEIKDYTCFVPIESAFKIRFYPKGDEYGMYFEDKGAKNPIEERNAEIIIHPNDKDNALDEMVGVSFMLEDEDIKKLYEYLVEITK